MQTVLRISRSREKPHILVFCLLCEGIFIGFSYEVRDCRGEKGGVGGAMKNSIDQE